MRVFPRLLLGLVTLAALLFQAGAASGNNPDLNSQNFGSSSFSDGTYRADAEQNINPLGPHLPLPTKAGEVFMIDDFDNKVTQTDLGSNYFMGNTGATESDEGITAVSWSEESSGSTGGSLDIAFDFTGQPDEGPFAGYFSSLMGLTDTKVSLDGTEPPDSTPFPGYFLDLLDVYRGSLLWPDRSVEQLDFDVRLLSAEPDQPIYLRIELTEEKDNPLDPDEVPRQIFTRREIAGNEWQPVSLALPNESGPGDFTRGDVGSFNPRRVSVLSLVVERLNIADGVENPDTGSFLVDNVRLVDTDGEYPDLESEVIRDIDGGLLPEYREAFLDLVRATSFLYFLDFASTDERTGGIIQDRSTFADLMTIGGMGFQATAYVIGAHRGYISREDAAAGVHSILAVLNNKDDEHPQGPDPIGTTGYKGFFYHFLGIDGLRKQNFDSAETQANESLNTVELSTIDTALAIAGVITAGQYFNRNNPVEAEIRSWAEEVYAAVDWPFMLEPTSNQFYLGWKPNEERDDDSGRFGRFLIDDEGADPDDPDDPPLGQYSSRPVGGEEVPATLDFYTDEGVLIALLAIASPSHPVNDDVFYSMEREGEPFVKTHPGALFTYQFGSAWLDTQALGADAHPDRPVDYFDNTTSAILATRDYAIDNPNGHASLSDKRWGLSATQGPFGDYSAEAAPTAAIATAGQCLGSGGAFALEGEDGTGDPPGLPIMPRGGASGGQTVCLHSGESTSLSFDLDGTAKYEVVVRYSNDGPPDTVEVSIDGTIMGQCTTEDTRPPGGAPGSGWNVFFSCEPLGPVILSPGQHELVVSTETDPYGVEIDVVSLSPIPAERPLEVGTVTVYGAGSSMVHTPDEAIAALWEAQNLALLHPRFGSADAFNLDIADAAIAGCVDLDEPRVLRTSGPWANFTGFSIDHGPMMILIDNYLEDQFTPNWLMSHENICEALGRLFPSRNTEDLDGYQDEDGCPDPDNDGDGILDGDDDCPNVPEDFDGYQDEDGCPEEDPPTCGGLYATIVGTAGNNTLMGTADPDVIHGLGGNDTISGLGGDDVICGGSGNDTLRGGSGNDTLKGDLGRDTLMGDRGWDTLMGDRGTDTADYSAAAGPISANLTAGKASGQGSDTLSGIENLIGSPGNDALIGDDAANVIEGRNGNDTLEGRYGNDTLRGGRGWDALRGGRGWDILKGNRGNDTLVGDRGNDTLEGGDGNDKLYGKDGNDKLYGNAGNDRLYGGPGNDVLNGGAGNDVLKGGTGRDIICGGAGADRLFGGDRADGIYGGKGNDIIHGESGRDGLRGGSGNDVIRGGSGTDACSGDAGTDVLRSCERRCDSAYPTICVPPPPPDLNCGDIPYRNFEVRSPDPHKFDGDHDGIGCETG